MRQRAPQAVPTSPTIASPVIHLQNSSPPLYYLKLNEKCRLTRGKGCNRVIEGHLNINSGLKNIKVVIFEEKLENKTHIYLSTKSV